MAQHTRGRLARASMLCCLLRTAFTHPHSQVSLHTSVQSSAHGAAAELDGPCYQDPLGCSSIASLQNDSLFDMASFSATAKTALGNNGEHLTYVNKGSRVSVHRMSLHVNI